MVGEYGRKKVFRKEKSGGEILREFNIYDGCTEMACRRLQELNIMAVSYKSVSSVQPGTFTPRITLHLNIAS